MLGHSDYMGGPGASEPDSAEISGVHSAPDSPARSSSNRFHPMEIGPQVEGSLSIQSAREVSRGRGPMGLGPSRTAMRIGKSEMLPEPELVLPQDAGFGLFVRLAGMQQREVVPDEKIAGLPLVPVAECRV